VGGSFLKYGAAESRRPPLMCSSRRVTGHLNLGLEFMLKGSDERGRCRLSNLDRKDVERIRSSMAIASETKERLRRRRLLHFERAARQLTLWMV